MHKRDQIEKARILRKAVTGVEKLLWEKLRGNKLGVSFRRQHPIDMFVLDFYCPKYKLAIELDGSPHLKNDAKKYDAMRTEILKNKEIKVVRFFNSEVENDIDGVVRKIIGHLNGPTPNSSQNY
jgi:very-short-patch-repair endonuclease